MSTYLMRNLFDGAAGDGGWRAGGIFKQMI